MRFYTPTVLLYSMHTAVADLLEDMGVIPPTPETKYFTQYNNMYIII